MTLRTIVMTAAMGLAAGGASAGPHVNAAATAEVVGTDGALSGSVALSRTASGRILVRIDLTGVPEGEHAVHLHETGDCGAEDFKSAGGHIAGDREHGVKSEGGPHPGDMPNMTVGSDGVLKSDMFLDLLDIDAMILHGDGAAFIMHAGADDYVSEPAGDAGTRIACGVFEAAG